YNNLQIPPPSGLCSMNYARHTHSEMNGNKWTIACNLHAPSDSSKGGNFYLASYGIMVVAASNTL
ncbi:hypothetical protein M434DRAFT_40062, partial [Hypoxylon sp. CO27-5]